MSAELATKTYLALVHHPVYDKRRRVVATSVTNLDIHDIARSCKTYGLAGYYIVHPVAAQRELVERILGHWHDGPGQEFNDFRRSALALLQVVPELSAVIDQITKAHGQPPLVCVTSAALAQGAISARALQNDRELKDRPLLLVFGTGWGLTDEVMVQAHRRLLPILGQTDYNHLSVRTAAGIMLDRLFAKPEHDSGVY